MRKVILSFAIYTIFASASYAGGKSDRQKAIQDAWYHCIQVYALTVAEKTNEPSSLIADAAMTACQGEEDKLYRFYGEEPEPVKSFAQKELLGAQRDDYRKKILVEILARRAS